MSTEPRNWSAEYAEATRLMGDRRTDLDALARAVAAAYLYAPEPFARGFGTMLMEIERRQVFQIMNPRSAAGEVTP